MHLRVDAGKVTMKTLTQADGLGSDMIGTLLLRDEVLWAATSQGVSRVGSDGKIASYALRGGIVKALAQDSAGTAWAATNDNMLSRFEGHQFVQTSSAGGNGNNIVAMAADRTGWLWLRMERGVKRLPPGMLYDVADGMPNGEVVPEGSSLPWLTASGEMWFPTRGGVAVTDTVHLPVNMVSPPVVIEHFLIDDVPQVLTSFVRLRFLRAVRG